MEYYSGEDIAEMKINGYEMETIDKSRAIQEKADELIAIISRAFDGVQLEDGSGFDEAQAIDDYKSSEQRMLQRQNDEKEYWYKIPFSELNRCNSSLSFFDAKGMRFHLPAYMIAEIKNSYIHDMSFCLTRTCLSEHSKAQFSLFSIEQREAVRCFLNYLFNSGEYNYQYDKIANSLLGFWNESND